MDPTRRNPAFWADGWKLAVEVLFGWWIRRKKLFPSPCSRLCLVMFLIRKFKGHLQANWGRSRIMRCRWRQPRRWNHSTRNAQETKSAARGMAAPTLSSRAGDQASEIGSQPSPSPAGKSAHVDALHKRSTSRLQPTMAVAHLSIQLPSWIFADPAVAQLRAIATPLMCGRSLEIPAVVVVPASSYALARRSESEFRRVDLLMGSHSLPSWRYNDRGQRSFGATRDAARQSCGGRKSMAQSFFWAIEFIDGFYFF